ncbi:MAG TPA: alpha-L-rhamnosidase N-terminal domain-containing protein, partial [Chitinophagaceae bacterium]
MKATTVLLLLVCSLRTPAQPYDLVNKPWDARWIAAPNEPEHDYGVYQFRKTFDVPARPDSFIVHISADNRYKMYVNGRLASLGPARGDIYHWNYETVNIAPFLTSGKNVIAVVVWNFAEKRPEAQISYQTGLIIQASSPREQVVNTNNSWKVRRDSSYLPREPRPVYSYYVAGPTEFIDYHKAAAGWSDADFDDSKWSQAHVITQGLPKGVFGYGLGWMLVPRGIPQMELVPQRLTSLRNSEGAIVGKKFPAAIEAFTIEPHTTATLLLDQGFLTDAYPVLQFAKGRDASITIGYAESLYVPENNASDPRTFHQKGDRNQVDGKVFIGASDSLVADGREHEFTSLWWRCFRYVMVTVRTANEPLQIDDFYGIRTGFPFTQRAKFVAGNDTLDRILNTGWRTATNCAVETYMDCPYYEQLQYVGDTRIQALVSLFYAGDDRLMRNAITLINDSRMAEGITLSRYPTANAQEIPPFSLWWIGMVHDYWMYRNDPRFVAQNLAGIRQVLNFFHQYQQPNGSLKGLPYWNFTDWCDAKGWSNGMAPVGKDGSCAALDLQLLWAYQLAAELEEQLGMKSFATAYRAAARQ